MALFSRSKKTAVEAVPAEGKVAARAYASDRDLSSVIVSPVITEKAMTQHDKRVYTFFVRKDATKYLIQEAVVALYKVTPVKINTVNKLPRQSLSRSKGRMVKQPGFKKAYVYLKAGDSISIA